MGILNLFKSKKRRELEYYESVLEISTEIFSIIKKKKEFSDRGIINLNFVENMQDKILVLSYYKEGTLNFISEKYREEIINVFINEDFDENYKSALSNSFHFLSGFISSLSEKIKELKTTNNIK